jgi:hypothetical protein
MIETFFRLLASFF